MIKNNNLIINFTYDIILLHFIIIISGKTTILMLYQKLQFKIKFSLVLNLDHLKIRYITLFDVANMMRGRFFCKGD